MQKPTEYQVADSNVENIGSAMDKAARHSAAVTECEWTGAGQVCDDTQCHRRKPKHRYLELNMPSLLPPSQCDPLVLENRCS